MPVGPVVGLGDVVTAGVLDGSPDGGSVAGAFDWGADDVAVGAGVGVGVVVGLPLGAGGAEVQAKIRTARLTAKKMRVTRESVTPIRLRGLIRNGWGRSGGTRTGRSATCRAWR